MNVASRLPDTSAAAPADRPVQSAKPPFLGFGLGLRAQHYDEILNGNPPIDWFEVISENYMIRAASRCACSTGFANAIPW